MEQNRSLDPLDPGVGMTYKDIKVFLASSNMTFPEIREIWSMWLKKRLGKLPGRQKANQMENEFEKAGYPTKGSEPESNFKPDEET